MSQYLSYIHNLRGLAILFVVGVHSGGYGYDWSSHPGVKSFLDSFFDPSEGNGTVLFLFIGGFLFQHLTHKHFDFKKYLEAKFLNIILPYIIISIPLILIRLNTTFDSLSLPPGFAEQPAWYQFFYHLVVGTHMPPFWFISTIVLFYFSAPLLHACDNRNFYRYGFPLVLLSCMFTYRPEHNANPLLAYVHFIPIYIMGMWASFNRDKILTHTGKVLPVLLIVYVVLTVMDLTGNIGLSREISFEQVIAERMIVFNVYMFKAIVLCFALMMVFYLLRNRSMPLVELLGHYSFGVFFVHYMVMSVSRKMLEVSGVVIDFSLPTYLIFFTFVLLVSIGAVFFIKRLTGRYSRYLIGS